MDGRSHEPMTYEFTCRFYLVGLHMFIISSVTLPLQALQRYSSSQYKIRKVPVIKAIYFFTLFVRKAVSVPQIFWELKDAFFSSQVPVPVIHFNLSLFELSVELGKETSI